VDLFVSGTGTGVGKTWVTRALAMALRARGESVAAIKPIETGCDPEPLDARALAAACGRPELADDPGFYRVRPPLAPAAAPRAGAPACDYPTVRDAAARWRGATDHLLVEGAGGLLVPLDAQRTIADLVIDLELPLLLVAHDALGVLSHTLTAVECARRRALSIKAIALRAGDPDDPSIASNLDILEAHSGVPTVRFPEVKSDQELAAAGDALLTRMPGFR